MYYIRSKELYHHGILGMKWGIRRYQPYPKGYAGDGKYVGETKKVEQQEVSGYFATRKEKKEAAKKEKLKKENLSKARQAAADKRNYEKDKARVLREGTATEVLKYKADLTNQELNDALNRIRMTDQLSEISQNELDKNFNKIDRAMKKAKIVNDWISTGISIGGNVDKIVKALDKASGISKEAAKAKGEPEQTIKQKAESNKSVKKDTEESQRTQTINNINNYNVNNVDNRTLNQINSFINQTMVKNTVINNGFGSQSTSRQETASDRWEAQGQKTLENLLLLEDKKKR